MKRTIVVKDELTGKQALKLQVITDSTTVRTKKVDYLKLVQELDNRVLTVAKIQSIMLKCSKNKSKVYYSEVLRALKSLEQQNKITVSKLLDKTHNRIYYSIHKVPTK